MSSSGNMHDEVAAKTCAIAPAPLNVWTLCLDTDNQLFYGLFMTVRMVLMQHLCPRR